MAGHWFTVHVGERVVKLVSPAGTQVECRDEQVPDMLQYGYRVAKEDRPARAKRAAAPHRASGERK